MKFIILIPLLVFAACGKKESSSPKYGVTTSSELIIDKGEPLEKSQVPSEKVEIYTYPDNEKFQIKNDIVTHRFRQPVGQEQTLIYWNHKFKECDTTRTRISIPKGDELPEFQMKCPDQGITVIYIQDSEFVSRVLEHEKTL